MSLTGSTRPWLLSAALAGLAALAACGGNPPPPANGSAAAAGAPAATATAAAALPTTEPGARATSKAGAPIDLAMVARPLDSNGAIDRYEIVLTATPRRELQRVELAIDGRPVTVAAATAGGIGEARLIVEVPRGAGKDVVGTAVVVVDGQRMGAATEVRVGAPATEAPAGTILQLPDGTRVQEVRP